MVCRRLVFLSGGITHSSFGGIGIAYFGLNPIAGAFCFAVLSAFGIERLYGRQRIREDSAIRPDLVARHASGLSSYT